jgi:thiamine-phosphate pyrophosphorylase
MMAGDAGADYVAFGAFYETETKDTQSVATPELLSWWQELMEPPCVAIGGITPDNAAPLITAGADFIALSSGVWRHPQGPEAAIIALNALLDTHFTTLFDRLNQD